jgi:hypothetical protein
MPTVIPLFTCVKVPVEGKIKNWFLGQNNIYTSSGKREFTSLVTV